MQLQSYEPPPKDAKTFVREFPLMTAKLACYMYHRCSEQEKSTIATDIKKNETALLKRFQLISSISFEQLKTDKIAEMFVYDFPVMSAEQAYKKYENLSQSTKIKIKKLIKKDQNQQFADIFTFTVKTLVDVQNRIYNNLLNCQNIKTEQSSQKIISFHQIPVWKLYEHLNKLALVHIRDKVAELVASKKLALSLDDIKLLQLYFKNLSQYAPKDPFLTTIKEHLRQYQSHQYEYTYKILWNLERFKIFFESDYFRTNCCLYLPLYTSFITTFFGWLSAAYIKNHAALFISDITIEKNKEIIEFNKEAYYYNNLIKQNADHLTRLNLKPISEQTLDHKLSTPLFDVLKMTASVIFCGFSPLFFLQSSLFTQGYIISCVLFSIFFGALCSYDSRIINSIYSLGSVPIVSLLYGLYFYKSVSTYMQKKHTKTIYYYEINKIPLQSSGIKIFNIVYMGEH